MHWTPGMLYKATKRFVFSVLVLSSSPDGICMKTLCSRTEYSLSCRQDITPQFTPSIHSDWENLCNRLQAVRLKGLKKHGLAFLTVYTNYCSWYCARAVHEPETHRLPKKRASRMGGSGGAGGSAPLFCHDVGFLTLSPKLDPLLDPPFLFCL